jgi:hypothetical protein
VRAIARNLAENVDEMCQPLDSTRQPLGRMEWPEDIAAALYLAADEAAFVIGSAQVIDGWTTR